MKTERKQTRQLAHFTCGDKYLNFSTLTTQAITKGAAF